MEKRQYFSQVSFSTEAWLPIKKPIAIQQGMI